MRILLATIATVLLSSAGVANAITLVTINENYVATDSLSTFTGNAPGISDNLSGSGNLPALALNTWSTPTNFFTATPAFLSGLSGSNPTVTGTISVTLNFSERGGTGSLTETATYQAKYGGSTLPCSDSPAGDTDCIDWTGAGNSPTGSVILAVAMTNGDILDVKFFNAEDWSITPQISFDLDPTPAPTPLPAALPLFAGGLGVLGLISRRRKRKVAAVAG